MSGRRSYDYDASEIRPAVTAAIRAAGEATADEIRLTVGKQLTGRSSWDWPDALNRSVLQVLSTMVEKGELHRSPFPGTRYRPVHYYTPERWQANQAAKTLIEQARADAAAAWGDVAERLAGVLGGIKIDKYGKPDLDLDTWTRVVDLLDGR